MSKPLSLGKSTACVWAAYSGALMLVIVAGVLVANSMQLAGSLKGDRLTVHAATDEPLRGAAVAP